MQRRIRLIVAVVALSALTSVAFAQRGFAGSRRPLTSRSRASGKSGRLRGSRTMAAAFAVAAEATDYPRAEYHFSQAVERLTRIDVHPDGHMLSPNTDDLFDYPWLYAVEVGSWSLDDLQAARMREYLLRGGFLMVDDFHGEDEWQASFKVCARSFLIGRSKMCRQTTPFTRSRMRSASASRYPDRATWGQACSMSGTME